MPRRLGSNRSRRRHIATMGLILILLAFSFRRLSSLLSELLLASQNEGGDKLSFLPPKRDDVPHVPNHQSAVQLDGYNEESGSVRACTRARWIVWLVFISALMK